MSWDRSYAHTLAIALDDWAASVFFNRPDLTISSMCGLVLSGKDGPLKLYSWQRGFLRATGKALNYCFKDHCNQAIQGDLERADSTKTILS